MAPEDRDVRQPDFQTDGISLYLGDCLEILPTLEAGSVDCVLTDPPYGIPAGAAVWRRNGTAIEDWGDELEELAPLEIRLRLEGRDDTTVPVTLESAVTEIGTMELWCVARDRSQRWKLELNIRERDDD